MHRSPTRRWTINLLEILRIRKDNRNGDLSREGLKGSPILTDRTDDSSLREEAIRRLARRGGHLIPASIETTSAIALIRTVTVTGEGNRVNGGRWDSATILSVGRVMKSRSQ